MSFPVALAVALCVATALAADDEPVYIPNQYLLLVNNSLTDASDSEISLELRRDYNLVTTGVDDFQTLRVISVEGEDDDFKRALTLPYVTIVEQNQVVELNGRNRDNELPCSVCHKVSATRAWGLDRIDQRDKLISDEPLRLEADYMVGPYRGAGVVAYVVDTGIDTSHPEFGGRAFCSHSAPSLGVPCEDDNGHGTHMSGIIGSKLFGVAKEVTLVGVKAFDSTGNSVTNSVCNSLAWVFNHHISRSNLSNFAKSVLNMSFGVPSVLVPFLVTVLRLVGVTPVASAGNDNANACLQSPANVPGVITVGAVNVEDETWSLTNWGQCVNVFAPGVDVISTYPNNLLASGPGTSQAAAHVTGAVAVEMSKRIAPSTPADMFDFIVNGASKNKIIFSKPNHNTSPNRLLHVPCCDISRKDAKRIGRD